MASVMGQRVRRREDPRFLTGKGSYVDDLRTEGALHVQFVRSYEAHARILGIDAAGALAVPGTQVFTAADVDLPLFAPPPLIPIDAQMFRPPIAAQKVRFVGDIVAVVLSETREGAHDAAELVSVEYEPLPVVTDIRGAERDDVLLFEALGTNTCLHVAVQDPGGMGGVQGRGGLGEHVRGAPGVQRAVRQHTGQGWPVDQFHHQVGRPLQARVLVVVDLGDAWMVEQPFMLGLGAEPEQRHLVVQVLGPEQLHRHVTAQYLVRGPPDFAHPADRDEFFQVIPACELGDRHHGPNYYPAGGRSSMLARPRFAGQLTQASLTPPCRPGE